MGRIKRNYEHTLHYSTYTAKARVKAAFVVLCAEMDCQINCGGVTDRRVYRNLFDNPSHRNPSQPPQRKIGLLFANQTEDEETRVLKAI